MRHQVHLRPLHRWSRARRGRPARLSREGRYVIVRWLADIPARLEVRLGKAEKIGVHSHPMLA